MPANAYLGGHTIKHIGVGARQFLTDNPNAHLWRREKPPTETERASARALYAEAEAAWKAKPTPARTRDYLHAKALYEYCHNKSKKKAEHLNKLASDKKYCAAVALIAKRSAEEQKAAIATKRAVEKAELLRRQIVGTG